MLKKIFVAAAIMLSIPAFASAQDIFWSFSPTELITTSTLDPSSTNGSIYIFSDGQFAFDALDVDFTASAPGVLRFSGGEAFNPEFDVIGGLRFNRSVIELDADGSSGRLFTVNVVENGVNPDLVAAFDPGFVPGVGPNGAVLLARLDYDLVGFGDVNFEFALGTLGAVELPDRILDPSFGSASLSMGLAPEFPIGDVNLSGAADLGDVIPFLVVLLFRDFQREADCNFDGIVSFRDIPSFIRILTSN